MVPFFFPHTHIVRLARAPWLFFLDLICTLSFRPYSGTFLILIFSLLYLTDHLSRFAFWWPSFWNYNHLLNLFSEEVPSQTNWQKCTTFAINKTNTSFSNSFPCSNSLGKPSTINPLVFGMPTIATRRSSRTILWKKNIYHYWSFPHLSWEYRHLEDQVKPWTYFNEIIFL